MSKENEIKIVEGKVIKNGKVIGVACNDGSLDYATEEERASVEQKLLDKERDHATT